MKMNFLNIFNNNTDFNGMVEKSSPRKSLNPSQRIRKRAQKIFEDEYQKSSENLTHQKIKHEKPKLKFLNSQYVDDYAYYSSGDNSITLNIAAFNHLVLAKPENPKLLSDVAPLRDYKFFIKKHPELKNKITATRLRPKDITLLLENTIAHELRHYEQLHRVLASEKGRTTMCKIAQNDKWEIPYIANFKPQIRYKLADKVSVPDNKVVRRPQFSIREILRGLTPANKKRWDAAEILARVDEIVRITNRLKTDKKLDKQQRCVLADALGETIEILKEQYI